MAWNDAPPTASELKAISWADTPPTAEELEATKPIGELESFGRAAANNVPLAPQAIAALSEGPYSQNLSEWNAKAAQAKATNPISYGAGAVTGTVAPMLIPGVGEALAASPVLGNAALGAASAISNTDLLQHPGEAAKQAAIGGTIGAGIGKVASMLPGQEDILAKATSSEAVAAKMANPGMAAGDIDQMARDLPTVYGKMKQASGHLSDYADEMLKSSPYLEEGAIPKDKLMGVIQNVRDNFTGMSDEGSSALKTIDQWAERADKLHNTISEQNLKGFIRNLDKDINWDRIRFDPTYQPSLEEQGMMNMRGTLDDMLKANNPAYGTEMSKISDILDTGKQFVRKFGLQRRGGEIVPGDTTANTLNTALKGSKIETQRILGKTLENTGEDIETPLLLRQFKQPTPENPAGFYSKVGAGLVGGALGHGMGLGGMGLGAVVGHRALHEPMSIAGRKGSEVILETLANHPALQQFIPSMSAAAQRGANSVIANHYILMQQDPAYNKAYTESMNGQQGNQ